MLYNTSKVAADDGFDAFILLVGLQLYSAVHYFDTFFKWKDVYV